jgi:hypothetical protein
MGSPHLPTASPVGLGITCLLFIDNSASVKSIIQVIREKSTVDIFGKPYIIYILNEERDMDVKALFEGKQLPTMKEQPGIMSIDTIERLWEVVAELPENRLVLSSKDGVAVIIGKMGIRDDGKFCLAIQLKAKYGVAILEQFEEWHMDPDEYGMLYDELVHALIEGGKLH